MPKYLSQDDALRAERGSGQADARRRLRTLAGVLLVLLYGLGGCHTMRFTVADAPAGPVVKERKSFFFWGLAPTKRVDMQTKCPTGVASIVEETNFVDGLCDLFTLGIWSPRSTYYTCRAAPAGG